MKTYKLAERAKISVSPIRQIFQQLPAVAKKRQMDGLSPLIDLSIGQPHIAPNPDVMKALTDMKVGPSSLGYFSAQGEPATLEAIVKLYKQYYPGVDYKTTEAMVTVGGSGALSNIFSVLVEKNDVILAYEPYFGAYTGQIQEWGGALKKIPTLKNHFRPTAVGLEEALKTNTNAKALILNYPNNPSGISLTRDEAVSMVKVLEKYPDVLIIIDDVYRDFNNKEHVTVLDVAPHFKDRCFVINSGAKGLLGVPGARVGMVAADEQLIKAMLGRQTNGISGVPYHTQAALRFAVDNHLKNPNNAWLVAARKEYKQNVETAAVEFKKRGFTFMHEPDGAFYMLASAKHLIGKNLPDSKEVIRSDVDIAKYFLHTAGVATVPGSGFGIDPSEGYLRISCAKDNHLIKEAAIRMGQAAQAVLHHSVSRLVSKPLVGVSGVVDPKFRFGLFGSAPAVEMEGFGAKLKSGNVSLGTSARMSAGTAK